MFHQKSQIFDPADFRVDIQEFRVDDTEQVVDDDIDLEIHSSPFSHLQSDEGSGGIDDQLHHYPPCGISALILLVLLLQEFVKELQKLNLIHVAVSKDGQIQISIQSCEAWSEWPEFAQTKLKAFCFDDVESTKFLEGAFNGLDLVIQTLLHFWITAVCVLDGHIEQIIIDDHFLIAVTHLCA